MSEEEKERVRQHIDKAPPVILVHPTYLRRDGKVDPAELEKVENRMAEAVRGRTLVLWGDKLDFKKLAGKDSKSRRLLGHFNRDRLFAGAYHHGDLKGGKADLANRLIDAASCIITVPTHPLKAQPFIPKDHDPEWGEEKFIRRFLSDTDEFDRARSKDLGAGGKESWQSITDFFKNELGVTHADAIGTAAIFAEKEADYDYAKPDRDIRDAVGKEHGLVYPDHEKVARTGCLPQIRRVFHGAGIRVLLPQGLTFPDSEEHVAAEVRKVSGRKR